MIAISTKPDPNLGGDLTGTASAATVSKLLGRTLHTTAPTNGQALIWDNTNSRWAPTTISGVTSMRPATKVVAASSGTGGTWNADATCDGTADDVEIQAAIDACDAAGGGRVLLTGGTFSLANAIDMKNGVELWGMGWSTRLQPSSNSFPDGALIQNADSLQHAWGLYNLMLTSNGRTGALGYIHGVWLYNGPSTNDFDVAPETDPDTAQILEGLFIYNMKGHGIIASSAHSHGEGSTATANVRGAYLRKIFILFARDCGVLWHGTDAFIDSVVCGGNVNNSLYSGFVLAGGNNRVVNSKAYYSKRHGLRVTGNRNMVCAFESQDNGWHGVTVEGDQNNLQCIVSDSAGRDKANNSGIGDGLYVSGVRNVVSAVIFDRNQTPSSNMRCGINLAVSGTDNIIMGSVNVANLEGLNGDGTGLLTYTGTRTGQTMLAVTTTEVDGSGQPMDEFRQGTGRSYLYTPNTAPTDSYIGNYNATIWLDTSVNPPLLKFRVRAASSNYYTYALTAS